TWVSASLFDVLRVQPFLGRTFTEAEDRAGHDQVMLLSSHLWKRRFVSDRAILRKSLNVNGKPHVVIGIMPESFSFPDHFTDAWFPVAFDADQMSEGERGSHWLSVIARLRPGITNEAAQKEMHAIAKQLQAEHADHYPKDSGWDVYTVPLKELMTREVRPAFIVLSGAVGFLLLITCANISNLLIARSISRQKEMAIRTALGASTSRLTRQLFTESCLLSVFGGLAGILLATWCVDLLVRFGPENMPRLNEISVDRMVLSFAVLVSVLTGIIVGLAPVLQTRRLALRDAMEDGDRATPSKKQNRIRSALVILEVAFSIVLLIGAALLIQSLYRLQEIDPGFKTKNIITMRLSLPGTIYQEPQQQRMFFQGLAEKIENLPEIESAGLVNFLPLSGLGVQRDISIEGRGHMLLNVGFRMIDAGYFRTLGIRVLEGRNFAKDDREKKPPVAIVNRKFVQVFFANEKAVGKQIKLGTVENEFPWFRIVGVVGDVRHEGLDVETTPELYIPYLQPPLPDFTASAFSIVVRGKRKSNSLVHSLRNTVWSIDPNLPVYQVTTMKDLLSKSLRSRRFNMTLILFFGVVALVLCAIGIYGLMSYSVAQRTHEIGIRMALGAAAAQVIKIFLKRALLLGFNGLAIGIAIAFVSNRFLTGLLYGISSTDLRTFLVVSIFTLSLTLLATAVPAWRASRLDAYAALRHQ
ncbi:ABC transporter permease, partial [bacterium]|nr:ABC transporter permease [bacterium]